MSTMVAEVEETRVISSEDFRKALRHFPAGVTIVTIRAGDKTHGLTVSAFASVSAEPALISITIENRHKAYPMLQEPEAVFAVNILGEGQAELSNRFAWVKDEDRFAMGNWSTRPERQTPGDSAPALGGRLPPPRVTDG